MAVDLSATGVLFLCVIALALRGSSLIGLGEGSISLVQTLVEFSHVFPTYLLALANLNQTAQRRRFYGLLALAVAGIAGSLHLYDPALFMVTYGALSLFHFLRQQYGFLIVTSRKNLSSAAPLLRLKRMIFFIILVTPIITLASFSSSPIRWMGFRFSLPRGVFPYATLVLVSGLLAALWAEVKIFRTTGNLNWSNYHQYFIAISTWIIVPVIWPAFAPAALVISHGLTYWFIALAELRASNRDRYPAPLSRFLAHRGALPLLYLATLPVAAALSFGVHPTVLDAYANGSSHAIAFVAAMSWPHYVLDGFIWKKHGAPTV